MTREEVIKEAEKRLSSVSFQLESGGNLNAGFRKIKEREYKFLRGVVFALRAQQTPAKLDRSRWEGCPMCTAHYTKQDWNTRDVGAHEFRVSGSSLMYCDQFLGWEGIGINFCPKCGRPLTEEAWAELERRINGGTTD